MKTQNTNVHIGLWHKDFWKMAIANLLLAMSVYSLIPVLPDWMANRHCGANASIGACFLAFALGVFALGPFCSYMVQRYRRNRVCILSVIGVGVCSLALYYDECEWKFLGLGGVVALRFAQGALYGLAKMVLTSTLIIDTCESFARTEANHSAAWFSRFALSLGPLAGLVFATLSDVNAVFIVSFVCAVLSALLIRLVSFPFKTPDEDVRVFSLDRFFLPKGAVLFVNLALVAMPVGLLLGTRLPLNFFGMLMGGFLLALLAQRFAFRDAELKSEVVSGSLLTAAGLLIMKIHVTSGDSYYAPVFIGMGVGICASRFLLFFIKLSRHCQRGTSQSTYLLGWELGVGLGLSLGFSLLGGAEQPSLAWAVAVSLVALFVYVFFTHTWFIKNKNR